MVKTGRNAGDLVSLFLYVAAPRTAIWPTTWPGDPVPNWTPSYRRVKQRLASEILTRQKLDIGNIDAIETRKS